MKHNISELFKVEGDINHIYSWEAIKDLNPLKVKSISYRASNSTPFRIYDKIESSNYRYGYMYGEHSYFDSLEEREEYRNTVRKEKEEIEARTFKLEGLTIKEVKEMISSIPDDSIVEKGMFRIH